MKKKIFLLLTVLAISIGTLWAQTSTTTNYTWDELYQEPYEALSRSTTTMYKYVWARGGGNYPAFWFYILFNKSEKVIYNGRTYPAKGNYTISSNLSTPNVIPNYQVANTESGSSTYCRTEYDKDGSTYYNPISGSGKVYEGADLPYITYSATSNRNKNGYTVSTGQYQKIYVNIGTAATYRTVTVQSESTTKGTVDYAMKSGYFYTDIDGTYCKHWKNGSVYTLTATPQSGYRFVCWKKGSTQISTNAVTDVTITGDATYTAYFEPQGGTQYTITTAVSPSNTYGTVTGAGSYYENNPATLTATSANEHLYFFQKWQIKNGGNYEDFVGNNKNPLSFTVTGNATYKAVFRTASNGTITTVADHGTVTGGGSYNGGDEVTLSVTADDGYFFTQWSDGNTDNPRTVYIDGDAPYTAEFVEGEDIYIEHGTLNHGGSWFVISGSTDEYEFSFSYDISLSSAGMYDCTNDKYDSNIKYSYVKPTGGSALSFQGQPTAQVFYWGSTYLAAIFETTVIDTNGKYYHVYICTSAGLNNAAKLDDGGSASSFGQYSGNSKPAIGYNGPYKEADNDYSINFDELQNESYAHYQGGLEFYTDDSKSGTIPSGTYSINCSGEPFSAMLGGDDGDGTYYNSWAYYHWYSGSGDNVSRVWILRDGKIDVIQYRENNTDKFYIDVYNAHSFDGTAIQFTLGYEPSSRTIDISAVNGSVEIENNGYGGLKKNTTNQYYNGTTMTLTASPATDYIFDHWEVNGDIVEGENETYDYTVTTDATVKAVFLYNGVTHNVSITAPSNGTITVSYNDGSAQSFTSGSRSIAENTPLTITATGAEGYDAATLTYGGNTYNANAQPFAKNQTLTGGLTVSATFTAHPYAITYSGLEGATNNTNPDTYNVESETITLAAPGARDGYAFTGWTINGTPVTEITHGSTGDKTLTATWTQATTLDLYDDRDATYYNNIKGLDGKTYDVTLNRTFKPGRWSTICLPFDYNQAQMEGHPLKGNINEYLYSEGNATSGGSGLTLYFKSAKSIEAGKPYLVYNTTGDDIVNPTFAGVTIDTDLDTEDADIDYIMSKFSVKQRGSISLVGTFRKIKLEQDHAYMGLMYDEAASKTKIYYPSTNTTVPAYRAFFYDSNPSGVQQRVRIVVDGMDMDEMLIDNGELLDADKAGDRAPRKYIRNGVLVIECNGVTYDAQGKRM